MNQALDISIPTDLEAEVGLSDPIRGTARLGTDRNLACQFKRAANEYGIGFLLNPGHGHFNRICIARVLSPDANDPSSVKAFG